MASFVSVGIGKGENSGVGAATRKKGARFRQKEIPSLVLGTFNQGGSSEIVNLGKRPFMTA